MKSRVTQLLAVKSKLILLLVLFISSVTTTPIYTEENKPLGLFGELVGNWRISDYSLDTKGEWQPAGGADWNFYTVLNGTAIQDDWISPSLSEPAPEQGRQYGTNIRIFNQQEKTWHMAWMANTGKKVETFKAIEKEGKIIMRGNYQGRNTRITFFNITNSNFSWTMEWEIKSEGQEESTWKTVYKIEGTRIN